MTVAGRAPAARGSAAVDPFAAAPWPDDPSGPVPSPDGPAGHDGADHLRRPEDLRGPDDGANAPAADGPPVRPGRVLLGDRLLTVERLVVDDPVCLAAARRAAARTGQDGLQQVLLQRWVLDMLALGVRTADAASAGSDLEALSARLDTVAAQMADASRQAADRLRAAVDRAADPDGGTVAVAVRDALARLAADVSGNLTGTSTALREQVSAVLHDSTGRAADRIENALARALSPADGPLALLRQDVARSAEETRRQLSGEVAGVRDLLAAARATAETARRSSAHGTLFEEQVVDAVALVASGCGDTVEPSGTAGGASGPRARSGDAVVRCQVPWPPDGLLLAVEAKDRDKAMSSEAWRRELDQARRNRRAAGALGVVRGGRLPGGRKVLVLDRTSLVVCWDPDTDGTDWLTAAYLLVRAGAAAAALAGTGEDADLAAVNEALASARQVLDGFEALDKSHGQAVRALNTAAETAARMRAALVERLGRAQRLLAPHGTGA